MEICSRYPDSKTVFQDLAFRRAEYLKGEINKKLDRKKVIDIDSFIDDEDNILQERTRGLDFFKAFNNFPNTARSLRRTAYRGFPVPESETHHTILETSISENPQESAEKKQDEKEKEKDEDSKEKEEEEIVNKKRSYSREDKKRNDDDSDTDDDLDNSMEVPLEDDMLNFDGSDDVDLVLEYIQVFLKDRFFFTISSRIEQR